MVAYLQVGDEMLFEADTLADSIERYECEEQLSTFLKRAWRYIDPARYIHGWVVDALCEHLQAVCDGDIRNLLINIPPRCLKSSLCSVAFPAWVWAQQEHTHTSGPGVPFLFASYAQQLAIRDSVKRRRLLKSAWYQRLWGDRYFLLPDQDQKVRFRNSAGGECLITSVDGGVTGDGGNIIVVDDPNNAREALSEAIIRTTNEEWWDGAMPTRRNDLRRSARIVIQQRLGELDLTGHILDGPEAKDWVHLCLPMEYETRRRSITEVPGYHWEDPRTEEGELLWEERFGFDEVRALEANLKKWRAAGQLQQRPEPQGGGIIKREWWMTWPPGGEDALPRVNGTRAKLHFPPFDYIVGSLDTAYTANTLNDPSALTIWGVFSGDLINQIVQTAPNVWERAAVETSNRVMLIHAWSGFLEIHDLVNQIHKLCQPVAQGGYNVDMLLIENKAGGRSVESELRRLFRARAGYSVRLMNPLSSNKGTGMGISDNAKVARLFSVQHLFEERMVWAPDRPWADQVITQCATVPNSAQDDLADTTSQALKYLRDIGLLVRGEERMVALKEALKYRGRPAPPLYPGAR